MAFYTGIGSRDTPKDIQDIQSQVGKLLASKGYTLRSGHAKGSDQAFERGCDEANGNKEIYLPWDEFEDSASDLIVQNALAFEIAESYHPYWHNLSEGAKRLQARNSHQILGLDLETSSDFLICYTVGGKRQGGTGQALRIAEALRVPIFDCGKYDDVEGLKISLRLFLMNVTAKYGNKI